MAVARKLTTKIYEIQAHEQKVTCLDLGESGRVMVTGSQDRNVNLWAIGGAQCFRSLPGHNGTIDCVKFAYNDNFVYSADEHGIIKRWDMNGGQAACSTFYGHMKSVRTLDFHPYSEYVASGSNDTSVRLWDVRKNNTCIETYRGHIANVNSVRFSPDGSWIASAGTEGCLIIWDIRQRKKIIEFQEHASPITCIQFHPFEFLIAAGRNDGTVDLYDLESRKLISRTDANSAFSGHTVKCVAFSENGECLFVGTAEGISVIGWEPDREFDHIEGAWSILGDMKVLTSNVYCASFEQQTVQIHDVLIEKVIPFYNPSNQPFAYNQSSRKSFTRGSSASNPSGTGHRLNLSGGGGGVGAGGAKKTTSANSSPSKSTPLMQAATSAAVAAASASQLTTAGALSFDMIEEEPAAIVVKNGFHFESYAKQRNSNLFVGSPPTSSSLDDEDDEVMPARSVDSVHVPSLGGASLDTPPSSLLNTTRTLRRHHSHEDGGGEIPDSTYIGGGDLDYYPMRSGLTAHGNGGGGLLVEPEREDFPIQSATPPDYAPKIDIVAHQLSKQQHQLKHKSAVAQSSAPLGRRHSPPGLSTTGTGTTGTAGGPRVAMLSRKFAAHSMSTMDLHQASSDDSLPAAGTRRGSAQSSRNYLATYASNNNNSNHNNNNNNHGAVKMRRELSSTTTSTTHYNRENNLRSQQQHQQQQKKITVQIYESAPLVKAPPTRSKTSLDMRTSVSRQSAPTSPTSIKRKSMHFNAHHASSTSSSSSTNYGHSYNHHQQNPHGHGQSVSIAEDDAAYNLLGAQHETVSEHLSRRHATLMLLKNFARTADATEALRHAIKVNDPSMLVDLFGIILETNAVAWTLDMVTMLLPELYELLRSENRFHVGRACDTLRHILDKFLPIIQENSDPYGAPRSLGVDITAEERRKKCIECRTWLLHIKALQPPSYLDGAVELPAGGGSGGTTLQGVQNMIVDL